MIFYDTCALLNKMNKAFDERFEISTITLRELEHIKTSASKDQEIKFKARRLIRLLDEHDSDYNLITYHQPLDNELQNHPILPLTDDSRIILSALKEQEAISITFVTDDLCCKHLAKAVGLNVEYLTNSQQDYTGFTSITGHTEEELAYIYSNLLFSPGFWDGVYTNEYIFIKNDKGKIIDKYKFDTNMQLIKIPYPSFDSKMFGKVKPKDDYQAIAMDSLKTNKITMLRGAAGTGKSYLAMGYLFSMLEKGTIEKILVFCNTVATSGSAKLGYYPGSRIEKLLDSQIGNFLSSKLGDRVEVERLIAENKLDLLPMSDIRGYDTTGLKAGIYITEAQNLDIELMRLALQRIGEDSVCILDGDSDTQVDSPLYAGDNNGMRRVSEVFRGDKVYGEVTLQNIYRSRIAQLAQNL